MGCDIHIWVETKKSGKWNKFRDEHFTMDEYDQKYYKKEKGHKPFNWRSYSMFAFFAGVRNYDHCEPLSEPRGFPDDSEHLNEWVEDGYSFSGDNLVQRKKMLEDNYDWHSKSYLTLKELWEFDYDKTFWNRRVTKQTGPNSWTGAGLAEEGEGEIISYRDNLGESYFTHLNELKELSESPDLDDVRIVFFFDN